MRLVRVPFSAAEADYYRALHTRSKTQFDAYVAEGKLLANYASVLELLLRLRQAWSRPGRFAARRADPPSPPRGTCPW